MTNRSIINDRASPTYLAKSEDPRKRLHGHSPVTNNPLAHTTTVYKASQGEFDPINPDGSRMTMLGAGLRRA